MDSKNAKYLPLLLAAVLAVVAFVASRRRKQPRSFREDPIGALKDHSEIFADKAQAATEEALSRAQETLDEIRSRLPEINRAKLDKATKKQRKELESRLSDLNEQAQVLLREVRSRSNFG